MPVIPEKVDHKYQTQKVVHNKNLERAFKAARYAQVIFALGAVSFICLLVYLLVQYPSEKQLLNLYNSTPECAAMAGQQAASSSDVCIIKTERIVNLYYKKTDRSRRTYYVDLREESGQTTKITFMPGQAFYESAHIGDVVHTQWFDGKIVRLQDGPFNIATSEHPQWQVKNSKTGFWVCSLLAFCSGYLVWMLRLPK